MNSIDYMFSCIRKIHESDRFFTYDSIRNTCHIVESMMRDLGMTEVRTEWSPSDGVTDYGGWLMPLCWNVKHAFLSVVQPDGKEERLCSAQEVPCSLMLYSRSADVKAEIAFPDAADVSGKIVFFTDHQVTMEETLSMMKRGAAGVICSFLRNAWLGQPGYEYLNHTCQWYNYQIPFWQVSSQPFGFSLTPAQGSSLSELLKKQGKVILHADVETETVPGEIPVVMGLLPGETNEEIVLTGHLFEEGANDNASGVAAVLAIVRELAQIPRKRGIRLMFTHECKSLQGYLNTRKEFPELVAGLNMDMVGRSEDGTASLGDGAPAYPTYGTALARNLLRSSGFSVNIVPITGNDSPFCEPYFGTAIQTMDFISDPDYHNSADIPERIIPEIMSRIFEVGKQYTAFLVNAGLPEAKKTAELCRAYDLEQKTAGRIANQRLRSVRRLVRTSEEKRELDSFLDSLSFEEVPVAITEQSEQLRQCFPVKNFRGFFSFEKFWCNNAKEKYPELANLFHGWSADAWVNNFTTWADGTRNAEEILNLVNENRSTKLTVDFFQKFLEFMKENGYMTVLKNSKNEGIKVSS